MKKKYIYKNKFSHFIFLLSIIFSHEANGNPLIWKATLDGNSIKISGTGFGTKENMSPILYTNFEKDLLNSPPSNWDSPQSIDSLVKEASAHSGSRVLDSSALNETGEYFPRVSFDMKTTIPHNSYLYLSAWLLLDNDGTTATSWNWKGPIITSSNDPYYWASGTNTKTAIGFAGFFDQSKHPNGWHNVATTISYSSDLKTSFNYCSSGNSWASDAFIFKKWQRVDWIFKTSSSSGAPDGSVTVQRIGKNSPSLSSSGCITYGSSSDQWRYVSIPQGITNITNGSLNLKMHFDDIYIDNNIARVELCDSSSWPERTHCEIQPYSNWSREEITVNFNQGKFQSGEKAYLYIIDEQGNVSNNIEITVYTGPSIINIK